MIKEILKTLSETELMAISRQLDNPSIDEVSVYRQLASKSNHPTILVEAIFNSYSGNLRGVISRLVSSELADRYRVVLSRKTNFNENYLGESDEQGMRSFRNI